jgi:Rps23 Pro-64 3,4-dihydroxylase Tpa1-like proline 4-hydroxylase
MGRTASLPFASRRHKPWHNPRFNTLTLFAVPQLHSVSMVTKSAAFRRYSITGWLRSR